MKLLDRTTKDLLALHNSIADSPAGPKTFATRAKLVARIEQIASAKGVDLSSSRRSQEAKAVKEEAQPSAKAIEAANEPAEAWKEAARKGVGALARTILMEPVGYPHALIAALVNSQIEGAAATDKSVRWYANDLRKKGFNVPPRRKSQLIETVEEAPGDPGAADI